MMRSGLAYGSSFSKMASTKPRMGIRADTDGRRERRQGGEAGAVLQRPQSIAQVLKERVRPPLRGAKADEVLDAACGKESLGIDDGPRVKLRHRPDNSNPYFNAYGGPGGPPYGLAHKF
jgi:hypothetical protein